MAPAVHLIDAEGNKLGICLNRAMKWLAGIMASAASAALIGAFVFAWQSNERLSKLDELPAKIDKLDVSMTSMIRENRERSIHNSEEIAEIKGHLGMPQDNTRGQP